MAHFIQLEENKKTTEDHAHILAREIWPLQGLPRDIVPDSYSRFPSNTWKDLLSLTGIRPRMSMTFHPQTDGQTEGVNQVIEAYLRPFLNQKQDDWVDLLAMTEYPYNNSITSETGMTPSYVNYERHPESQNPKGRK